MTLGQRVKILPLEGAAGRVVSVIQDWMGTSYKVNYYHNGEQRTAYCFDDELEVDA